MDNFFGTGVALVTPFSASDEVDVPALQRLVHHVQDGGCEVLVPLGTTGESATLSEDEKRLVLDTVFAVARPRSSVWIGCGGNHTAAVAQELEKLTLSYPQAQGFLSVSPAYNKPSQEGIYRHYAALAQATDKPLLLYNVPSRTASTLLPETIFRLANDVPTVVGVKDAVGDLSHSTALAAGKPEGFQLISGDDPLAFFQMSLGYVGCISVIANVLPDLFSNLIRASHQGNLPVAKSLHLRLQRILNLLFQEGNPTGIKAALAELNLLEAHTRLPLVRATPGLQAQLASALRQV